jgi:hypothetical protein
MMWLIPSVLAFIGFLFWFFPVYNVWQSRKSGEASLAEAQAVAESIEKIGSALRSNQGYLRWQWIKMMKERDGQTVYVPTEANLPILEARNSEAL